MNIDFDLLKKAIEQDQLTPEQHIEAVEVLTEIQLKLGAIPVFAAEPDDIDEEVTQIWTEAQLKKLREIAVVAIANDLGIDASVSDKKQDTIDKILELQKTDS